MDRLETITKLDGFEKWARRNPDAKQWVRNIARRLLAVADAWPEPSQPKGSETATETDGPTERITLP